MKKKELSVVLFLLTCSVATCSPFEDGHKHYFTYSATSHVLGLHNLTTIIKFHVLPVNRSEDGSMNLLKLDSFVQRSSQGYVENNPKHWNLTRSFLFHVTGSGVVSQIFHHPDEEHEVLTLKKLLAGTMSMYKKRSHLENWRYSGWETDQHGKLLHTYIGRRVDGGTTFSRRHNSSEHVHRLHEKTISYDHRGLITAVTSKDTIRLRNKPAPPESVSGNDNVVIISTENGDFPSITSVSDNHVKLTARRRILARHNEDYSGLKSDSPQVRKAKPKEQQLKEVEEELKKLLNCVASYPDQYAANKTQCVHELKQLYNNLTREGRLQLAQRHLTRCPIENTVCNVERSVFLDILCGRGDQDSQELVLKYVLHDTNVTEDDIRTVLYHYINMKEPIKETVDAVEHLCFQNDYQQSHTEELEDNQMRACLTLGGLLQSLSTNGNHTLADDVMVKLENKLGMYNHKLSTPIVHRGKRSIYEFDKEQHDHIITKMVLIHSLGNAGMSRSLRHIRSYLQPNRGAPAWRRAAATSLRYFKCNESALALFDILAHDTDEKVHKEAREVYLKHPRKQDLLDEKEALVLSRRFDYHTVMRVKRKVKLFAFEILDGHGFYMKIKAPPGINWQHTIGTSNVGANVGVRLINELELKLHPLNSFFKVNIDNEAWIRADVGMINVHIDIAKAKFCFQGHIEYDLNVLKEFSIDHFKELLGKLNDMIHKITHDVKEAIALFKKITNPAYIRNLFTTFIQFIKSLPNLLVQFVQDFIKLVKKVIHYHADPIIEKIKQIGMRIKAFAEEVKQDVLEFYHSIADAVMITLPNVGKMLKEAGDDIISVFRDFFKSPTQSFSKLEQVVIRVQLAVSMIIDAKNRIMDASFFTKGSSPLWMHLSDDVSVIIGDIKELVSMVVAKVNNLLHPRQAQTGALPSPDNNGIMGPYDMKSWFHEEAQVMLSNVTASLSGVRTAADPFFQTFHDVMTLIKDVKTAYETVKTVIHVGKSVIQRLFGGKFHKKFPSEKEGGTCTDAVWPSTAKEKFNTTGVDVKATSGKTIVNPVTGTVRISGSNEVTISPTDRHFTKYVIVLNNISPLSNITRNERLVEAGKPIGKAGYIHCQPNFIHVAMYVKNTNKAVDPTKYLHRKIPLPMWITDCNERSLTILGLVFEAGGMSKNPHDEPDDYKTHQYRNMGALAAVPPDLTPPFKPDGLDNPETKDLATSFKDKLSPLKNLENMMMSLKKRIPHIQEVFNINTMSVATLREHIKAKPDMVKRMDKLVSEVASSLKDLPVVSPAGMSLFKLRTLTKFFKLNVTGDKLAMVTAIRHNALKDCPNLNTSVSFEFGHYCTAHFDCQGMTCGTVFEYSQYLKTLKLDIRRCDQNIAFTVLNVTTNIDVNGGHQTFDTPLHDELLDGLYVNFRVTPKVHDSKVTVSVSGALCAVNFGTCLPPVSILADAVFENKPCSGGGTEDPFINRVHAMSVRTMMSKVSQYHLGITDALALLNTIREALLNQLFDTFNGNIENFMEEFSDKKDSCIRKVFPAKPHQMLFFKLEDIHFMVGPIPMGLGFGASGETGHSLELEACFMSMKITGKVIPGASLKVWGEIYIDIGFALGGLELTGYIMTIRFPVAGTIGFPKFPLDVGLTLDMELVPLTLVLEAYAKLRLLFFKVEVFRGTLWKYQTSTIRKNLLTFSNKGSDSSAPTFSKNAVGPREKRSVDGGGCEIKQLEGRHPTDTAFLLEFTAEDDVSDVKTCYAIGTHEGGTDVVSWTEMAGNSLTMPMKLPNGVPLFWTVKARNSQGGEGITQCMLHTFDNTPPDGRVDDDFRISSNPFQLGGTVVVLDDSNVDPKQHIALGLSSGEHGNELSPWSSVMLEKTTERSEETTALKYFSLPKMGKLSASPIKSLRTQYDVDCARECMNYGQNCVSFDYDYSSQTCDFHDVGEGPSAQLRKYGSYKSFERLGVGQKHYKLYKSLNLTHGETYFINTKVVNDLGYRSILPSHGTLIDLTPPSPGPIGKVIEDRVKSDGCSASILQRCKDESGLPNHRLIIDGEGSSTVFNGHTPLNDEKYTLSNNLIAGNWDGFHDNETDIYGYTWAAGTSHCSENIVNFNDPHANLPTKEDWTYSGLTSGLVLKDGLYFITVQAINNVVHGGALVTTVCHSTPLIVDTTPPIFNSIDDLFFDEDFELLGVYYNGSDPLSQINKVHFGLGKTKNDVDLLSYEEHESFGSSKPYIMVENFKLQQGVPAWPRLRLTNNVGLSTSGHANEPLIVDDSPPVEGQVKDGNGFSSDQQYQSDDKAICVRWQNFFDAESGISSYMWGVGTSPGADDIVSFTREDRTVHSDCHNVQLQHNTTYFSTVIVYNAALNQKKTSATSDGVLVDITDPVKGWIKDGDVSTKDMSYSSELALIQAVWGGFSDPESGITKYEVEIFINGQHRKTNTIIQESSKDTYVMNEKTLELKQGDRIYSKIRGFNGAGKSVEKTSDGFTIDLTPPVAYYVHDNLGNHKYQRDRTTLNLSWKFEDKESGMARYLLTVMEDFQGMQKPVWPVSGSSSELRPAAASEMTHKLTGLNLEDGARYFAHVVAINNAKMSKTIDSSGVSIDSTPPIMDVIHIGHIKEEEDIEDGKIRHTDKSKITVSWRASDPESDISKVYIAIGTSKDDHSITNGFLVISGDHEVTLKNLNMVESETSGNYYYVQMKVENGAGAESKTLISKPIDVLPGNVPGIIYDGRKQFKDAAFTHDTSTFAMSFAGFKSIACGIVAYEWGIGTEPFITDIVGFTGFGIVKTNQSSGFGQMNIQLFEGVKYFTTVRARTGHKCYEDYIIATSNGLTVDTQEPTVKAANMKGHIIPDVKAWGVIFQNETDIVEIVPEVSDSSGVNNTVICLGSFPFQDNIHQCQQQKEQSIKGLSLPPGESVFITIRAQDNAENEATWESVPLIPDTTPPELINLKCTSEISEVKTEVECSWHKVNEHESHLRSIALCIGLEENPCSIIPEEDVPLQRRKWRIDLFREIDHLSATRLFVTMKIRNFMNNEGIFTREIVVDKTAPKTGLIRIVTDDKFTSVTESKACQVAQTYVETIVTGFEDKDTGMDGCQIALGSKPGTTNIHKFQTIELDSIILFGQLPLQPGDFVYATAICHNRAGMSSKATSDPVVISPKPVLTVHDGAGREDEDYQTDLSTLQGRWHYSDGCPVTSAEWQIMTVSWNKIQDFSPVHGKDQKFYSDELHLTAGVTYINVIRITDALERIHVAYSDGITVAIEPPLPGTVRDGTGTDVDYQTSTTELSVNWDIFGKANSTEATQQIVRYEVAVGDDVRNPDSRSNVRNFQDVNLHTSYTFRNLSLTPKKTTYYVTVRAFSKAGSFQEAYSDGIKVGFDLDISPGLIELRRYTSSKTEMTVAWSNFYSDIGITSYSVGITKHLINMPNQTTPCKELEALAIAHNMSLLSSRNSMETFNNLDLMQGESYYVTVIAHDKADSCRSVNKCPTTVDVTPPTLGELEVDGGKSEKILFIKQTDRVTINWTGFEDKESGIKMYTISLSSLKPCLKGTEKLIKVINVKNRTSATIYKLNLDVELMYTVQITAVNNAGRNTSKMSQPFLIDTSAPLPGTVKVGKDWRNSRYFQNEQTKVDVLAGLVQHPKGKECKKTKQLFPQISSKQEWVILEHVDTSTVLVDNNYAHVALTYDHTLKDIIAGGLARNLGKIIQEGNYTVKLKSARGKNIITSMHIDFGRLSEYTSPKTEPLPTKLQENEDFQLNNDTNTSNDTEPEDNKCLAMPGIAIFFYGNHDEDFKWKARICVRDDSKAKSDWFDLPGDPSEYLYETVIRFTQNIGTIRRSWKVDLLIEGHKVTGTDGYIFSGQPNFIYRIQTLEGYKPPVGDPLQPFRTQAALSYLGVPDTTDKDCLHGEAFYDGESGIKDIWVGISSSKVIQDDIFPFTHKASFCLPCWKSCQEICDTNCSTTNIPDFSVLQFQFDNITLDHSERGSHNDSNSTQDISFKAPTYYVNVKAVNFANQSTVSVSNAFQVDITPPEFKYMMCVDPVHSLDEPTDFIGSNNSVGAFWDCDEDVSEIAMYTVEIGSTKEGNDILKATPVDLKKKVGMTLKHTTMADGKMYFVTSTAVNSAGLSTKATCNITVMLGGPGTSRMYAQPMFVSSYTVSTKVPLTNSQSVIGVEVHGALDIFYYEWEAGMTPSAADVFPTMKVASKSSTVQMSIQQGQLWVDGKVSNISLSDYNNDTQGNKTKEDDHSFLFLEPGRCLYHSLRAVGHSHLASEISTQPMCIKRDKDILAEVHPYGQDLHIGSVDGNTSPHNVSGKALLSITLNGHNGSMIIGNLNRTDTTSLYGSAATADFVPYITDPEDTLQATSRVLFNRLVKYTGLSFFMSPATQAYLMDNVTVIPTQIAMQNLKDDSIELLLWDTKAQVWEFPCDVQNSGDMSKYQICLQGQKEKVSGHEYTIVTEPQQFALFEIKKEVQNTAPVFITKSLDQEEDNPVTEYIEVMDREDDYISFNLKVNGIHGNATISPDGYLTYVPDNDFCGQDVVTAEAVEYNVPDGAHQYHVSQDIVISVQCIDDPPELHFISVGDEVYRAGVEDTVNIELESSPSSASRHMLGYFALSDNDDSDELSLLFDSEAAKDVGLQLKNITSDVFMNHGHNKSPKGKTNIFYELWVDTTTAGTHNRTIKFRGKDHVLYHSNPISLKITIKQGNCQGSTCGAVKTEGIKRDKATIFEGTDGRSKIQTPPPEIFRQDYLGVGTVKFETSNSTSNTVILTRDGVFSKGRDTDKSDGDHMVFKVSGKLTISTMSSVNDTSNGSSTLPMETDLRKRVTEQHGMPFTVSIETKDIPVSHLDVKVTKKADNTSIAILVRDSDGTWREVPAICNNSKPGLLDEDQLIITLCPELLFALKQRIKQTGDKLSVDIVLSSVKEKSINRPPVLLDKVVNLREGQQLYVQLHAEDPDGDSFIFHVTKDAEHGFADVDSTGNLFYTPSPHFSGEDRIYLQLQETKVLDGSPPKVTNEVLVLNVSQVNDPPILYYQPPIGVHFRVENDAKILIDVVRAKPYTSSVVNLGYLVAFDWDTGDDLIYKVESLNKTTYSFFEVKGAILSGLDWLTQLSNYMPGKKAYSISIHFLSEVSGTLVHEVSVKDKAGAGVDLHLYINIAFQTCQSSLYCVNHVSVKSVN